MHIDGPIAQLVLERAPDKREVDGSSPFRPTMNGVLAQLGERLLCKQEVSSSILLYSTKKISDGGVAQLARAYGSYP